MKDNEIIKIVPGLKGEDNDTSKLHRPHIRLRDYFTVHVQAAHRLHFCRAGSNLEHGSKGKN
jgi:hypothetical protein